MSALSDWTHVVLNYIGPQGGEGFTVYYNGVQSGNGTTKGSLNTAVSSGDGGVVVGKYPTNLNLQYSGVDIDELLFFNRRLSDQDVQAISNMI